MSQEIIQATHGSPDHPLVLGELEIPCYVLEDGQRVLVQGAMIKALGMSHGGSNRDRYASGDRLARFAHNKSLEAFMSDSLREKIEHPLRFKTPHGSKANGYEATVLADLCETVLQARDAGRLQSQQQHIAVQCDILIRGFARVGIIALVDEATGYQEFRARQALEEILQQYISTELMKWVKTFPDEFYRELYRLRGLTYHQVSTKRPAYLGKITNDIVYSRLAPGVLEELQRITPKGKSGGRKHKFHQRLTSDVGHPKLQEHLLSVITLMKASPNYDYFYRLLQRALPRLDIPTNLQLPLEYDDE